MSNKFSIKKRINSFKFAINGLLLLFKEEHNSRIHLTITILVVIAGIAFKIRANEWLILSFSIGFVFVCELFNSAIENLCDFVSPAIHSTIKKVKDYSAAAVLLSACVAIVAGLIVFLPYVWYLLSSFIR